MCSCDSVRVVPPVMRRPKVVRSILYCLACAWIEGRVEGGVMESQAEIAAFMRCSFVAIGEVVVWSKDGVLGCLQEYWLLESADSRVYVYFCPPRLEMAQL
jgi:hypothetical protein